MGNKNSNSISARYRGLHYSYIGHIDLTVCGNSDPGTSGVLTPYGKMDGLYFDGSPEPDDFMFDFHDAVQMVAKSKGATFITIDFENKEDYYKALNEMRQFTEENVSIITTSKESDRTIIIEPELNLDDRNNK